MTKTKESENEGSTHHFISVQSVKKYKRNVGMFTRETFPARKINKGSLGLAL